MLVMEDFLFVMVMEEQMVWLVSTVLMLVITQENTMELQMLQQDHLSQDLFKHHYQQQVLQNLLNLFNQQNTYKSIKETPRSIIRNIQRNIQRFQQIQILILILILLLTQILILKVVIVAQTVIQTHIMRMPFLKSINHITNHIIKYTSQVSLRDMEDNQ